MGQIEKLFYNHPVKLFHIRGISRITNIPKSTVANRIKNLIKQGIVIEEKDVFKAYKANESDSRYRRKKTLDAIQEIFDSGLVDYLHEKLKPNCIVLFGSMRKGEYTENSDIDLFVQCKEQKINLNTYRKKLGRDIQIFMDYYPEKMSKRLLSNILNGFVLSGYINVL